MKRNRYRVKAQEITTHIFIIAASEKDEAEEIAYDVLHGKATNEELDAVLDEMVDMDDHFSSRELKGTHNRHYDKEDNDL